MGLALETGPDKAGQSPAKGPGRRAAPGPGREEGLGGTGLGSEALLQHTFFHCGLGLGLPGALFPCVAAPEAFLSQGLD